MRGLRVTWSIALAAAVAGACSGLSDLQKGAWLGAGDAAIDSEADGGVVADGGDEVTDPAGTDSDPADLVGDAPDSCDARDHQACFAGSLYWIDSCGGQGDLARSCACGCLGAACLSCGDCPEGYVTVQPGTFKMGASFLEFATASEKPRHDVAFSRSFCLKETELTQGEWQAVMGNNPAYFAWCGSDCPVEMVSWWDAVAFCNRLSAREGLPECYTLAGCSGTPGEGDYACIDVTFRGTSCTGYRLPTEAEWEFAARAGTTTDTYHGALTKTHCATPNEALDSIAWYRGNSCASAPSAETCAGGDQCGPHVVRGLEPNAWGLFDMLGNVNEWVWDWLGPYPVDPVENPIGPSSGQYRLLRGGGWGYGAEYSRSAWRDKDLPGDRSSNIGMRPARSLCVPRCDGLQCGDDGCEGSCGTCTGGRECIEGQCACAPRHRMGCVGLDLFWFDSCGVQETRVKTCTCGCQEGACTPCGCPDGFVPVPAGTFTMGSPAGASGGCAEADETAHPVTIGGSFCMKASEVTQAEWFAVARNNPSLFDLAGGSAPVENVSWWDAVKFCNLLSDQQGLPDCYVLTGCGGTPGKGDYICNLVTFAGVGCTGYRLPTEAEWEYAARAGTTGDTYAGSRGEGAGCEDCGKDKVLDDVAWWCGDSESTIHPVMKDKQANAWGLHDMLGNVWEWVWDWHADYPSDPVTDPLGPASGSSRVRRGGAFDTKAGGIRAANREPAVPDSGGKTSGFRPVRWACSCDLDCPSETACDAGTGTCKASR